MNAKKLTDIALATAAACIFSMTAMSTTTFAADEAKIQCDGANACKGTSECKTDKNACKGQNACKGTGFKAMSKAECDKAKAEVKK